MSRIFNPKLAGEGKRNFLWAKNYMGALAVVAEKYTKTRPLEALRDGVYLHVTKETSVLIDSLERAGANITLAAANPLSTQDDIAAYLATKVEVYARRGESLEEYDWCIRKVLASKPNQLIDDGADLHVATHTTGARGIVGGSEETTTGVMRLKELESEGKLAYLLIAVNNARADWISRIHGTMQNKVHGVPEEIEQEIARAALQSMCVSIGKATREQKTYTRSWKI
jgi:adenosylhomocysteinase